jgi:flavin reductase (DIM6/NTAB) family NADH-FMN oxidoreductase RutF
MPDLSLKFADLQPRQRYKLLCGLVVPRPIALVSTLSPGGVVNAAPFSFFNVFSENPPLLVLGLQHNDDGSPKDTTRNIHVSGEFVVNLVDEAIADDMNLTAIDFPPEESEPAAAGMKLAASTCVKPPRLAAAPAAFECRRTVGMAFGPQRELLIGEVLAVHAREGIVDPATLNVDFGALAPVGRLCGNMYARQRDMFELKRVTYAEWRKTRAGSRPDRSPSRQG